MLYQLSYASKPWVSKISVRKSRPTNLGPATLGRRASAQTNPTDPFHMSGTII